MARHATVQTSAASGGGVAPRAVARSAGSNVSICPALIENATVPVEMTVTPLGNAGWLGIGGSDAPGGSVGVLDGGVADTDGGADARLVDVGDGDAVRVGVGVADAVAGAVAAAGRVGSTATTVEVPRGVGVAVMRSVSEHAVITQTTSGAIRARRCVLTAQTRRA